MYINIYLNNIFILYIIEIIVINIYFELFLKYIINIFYLIYIYIFIYLWNKFTICIINRYMNIYIFF